MSNLPPEIWQRTFIQLELNDRFSCTLVCRNWWNILDGTCLLYSVGIRDNKRAFILFMNMIKNSPHRAVQVQDLDLYNSITEGFNKRRICCIFPNARVINVADSLVDTNSVTDFTEHLEVTHSKSTVQVLHDSGYCELTMQIINSNMGDRLKKLDLDFIEVKYGSRTIFTQLRNMPLLEELSLHSLSVTVMDLEMVHENLPTLRKLTLDYVSPNVGEIPVNITPADLTKLRYYSMDCGNQEALSIWYHYMSRKYINIKDFRFTLAASSARIDHVFKTWFFFMWTFVPKLGSGFWG
jgi:hypothetical protein